LLVPIVEGTDKVALCFGASYQWLELESAELITQKAIYTNLESEQTIDASPYLAGEQMADKGGGLFECLSADSLLVLTWPKHLQTQNYILRVIFRPIVARAKQITN
jgi:hypothetical protein